MAGIKLFPWQLDALYKMHNGCILCGGVGSGKSITSLAYYYINNGGQLGTKDFYPMKSPKDLYIITTARKRDTLEWDKELVPFLLSTDQKHNWYSNKVVIDSWNNITKYASIKDSFFIFDEQRVVGSGKWSKTFIKIARANKWILLSATPGDSWSDYIPVFIANGFFKNRSEFYREHVVYKPFTSFPQIDHYVGDNYLNKLRRQILVDMKYDTPATAHHEDVFVNFDKNAYKDISRNRWNPWTDSPIENPSEYCQALRRIVNSSDSRQIAVMEIVETHPKVIIFYNYDYELEILRSMYYGENVKVAEWNGHKHEPVPDGDKWVYLVQYTAGAEGWNCVSTDTIIFYSQNYSYKIMVQSAGRIDRLTTPFKDLYYYHIRSRSGIDLAISRALSEKKKFNEKKFVGDKFVTKIAA